MIKGNKLYGFRILSFDYAPYGRLGKQYAILCKRIFSFIIRSVCGVRTKPNLIFELKTHIIVHILYIRCIFVESKFFIKLFNFFVNVLCSKQKQKNV